MHAMNRQLLTIKIIPRSNGFRQPKLQFCSTEPHYSRRFTELRPKAGILIVSRESTGQPFKQAGKGQLSMKDDEQIEKEDLVDVAPN